MSPGGADQRISLTVTSCDGVFLNQKIHKNAKQCSVEKEHQATYNRLRNASLENIPGFDYNISSPFFNQYPL